MAYENLIILAIIVFAIVISISMALKARRTKSEIRDLQDVLDKKRDSKKTNNVDILKTRLAKGEISKEEYDDLVKEFES